MKAELEEKVMNATWHNVTFFQLRSLSLPTEFESEIQNTEVKNQDIKTAKAERDRDSIGFETNVEIAKLAVNSTVETAKGEAAKTIYQAQAEASTISQVIKAQVDALKSMKANFTAPNPVFGTPEILGYLKNNLVKEYTEGKIAVALDL